MMKAKPLDATLHRMESLASHASYAAAGSWISFGNPDVKRRV